MNTMQRRAGLVGVLLVAAVAAGCRDRLGKDTGLPPECPHNYNADSDSVRLLVPGVITNVPEYHDCQRFLVRGPTGELVYDSLQAIYVRYNLYGVFAAVDPSYIRPAKADTFVSGTQPVPLWQSPVAPARSPKGAPHIQIIALIHGDGEYKPLGIKPGFNCVVFLWASMMDTASFRAWIFPVGDDQRRCDPGSDAPLTQAPAWHQLAVDPILPLGVQGAAVARWDWDFVREQQYIVIACPSGWCALHSEKGPVGTTEVRTKIGQMERTADAGFSEGAYDAQYLAKYSPWPLSWFALKYKLIRDGTFGLVIPDPGLAAVTFSDYQHHQWVPVAATYLTEPSAVYKSHLNFSLGQIVSPGTILMNAVAQCFSTSDSDCDGKRPVEACDRDLTHNGYWYARVISAQGTDTVYRCVHWRETKALVGTTVQNVLPPPGVVRWRWLANDETMWISCPAGCCMVKVPE